MQNVFYALASLAAVLVIIAIPVLAVRALVLMARLDDTRRDLAKLIAEGGLSLHHANRFLVHAQDGVDRLRHAADRLEHLLGLLQPATAVGGLLASARRALSGQRQGGESTGQSEHTEGASS